MNINEKFIILTIIILIIISGCISENEDESNDEENKPDDEKKAPDLNISENDISFKHLNATIKEGDWVNISVKVHNTGQADATKVIVRFFNDSEIIMQENEGHVLIKKIPINEDRLVWVNWTPIHSGLINITIKLYCNEIESNFTNNVASKELEVKPK
jgi:hypothetical protein